MITRNFLLKKTLLVLIVSSFTISSSISNAGSFSKIVNSVGSTANSTFNSVSNKAQGITGNIDDVTVNKAGKLVDKAGNAISEADLKKHVNTLFKVDPLSGLAILKQPFESTADFRVALGKGAWVDIGSAIKQEAVFVGVNAGVTALQIKNNLSNFDSRVNSAFKDSSNFILDGEAAKKLGQGLKVVRGALSECVGSKKSVDQCFDEFIDQFIGFYKLIRHFMAKVNHLKSYASGSKFNNILNKIHKVEKKSVKYFLPALHNSKDKIDFSSSENSFAEKTEVHESFEKYASIANIRNSLARTTYSYHNDPQRACNRVSLPIICDSYDSLDDVAINRFNFNAANLSTNEANLRKKAFHAMSAKAFGSGYRDSTSGERSHSEQAQVLDYLASALYQEINWSQIQDQRIPYIVKDEVLGGAGGAFIASENDSIILLNEELFTDDTGLEQGFNEDDVYYARSVAIEEMGHWLNWKRCQYDSNMLNCASNGDTFGDPGAKFSNASFIEYSDFTDYLTQLQNISEGFWSQPALLSLRGGATAVYEGNPSLVDIQTALANTDTKVRFRMRTQMGTPSSPLGAANLGSSGIIEVNYTPPKRIKAKDIENRTKYGYHDEDKTLYLGNIGIVFAIENYVGVSTPALNAAIFLIKFYGEVGVKSSLGISIPLLRKSAMGNNLANIDSKYRDKNISLSYSVSPYVFNYTSLLGFETGNFKGSIDQTNAIWGGLSVGWPANTGTIPLSLSLAGITIASSGIGCVKGMALFSSTGTPITPQMQCALGAQFASGLAVTGTGVLASLSNSNVSVTPGSGWVNGIRVKFQETNVNVAAEARFEVLFSKWKIGN